MSRPNPKRILAAALGKAMTVERANRLIEADRMCLDGSIESLDGGFL